MRPAENKDEDTWVRVAAAEALGKLHWKSGNAGPRVLPAASGNTYEIAAERPAAVDLQSEATRDSDAQRKAVEALWSLLWDEGPAVRRTAVEAMGHIGGGRAVELLVKTLQDPNKDVRWAAAWALGKIADPRAVDPLVEALRDPEKEIREAAAEALGRIGEGRAVDPLVEVLMEALADTPPEQTVKPLLTFAAHPLLAEIAAQVLTRVLEHAAAEIAVGDLRAVARLQAASFDDKGRRAERPEADFSQARHLARQELRRRGLEV